MGRPHRAQTPFAILYFADRSVFLLDPIEEDLIIRPLGDLDLLRHAPSQRLLVQWNKSSLLVNDPERLRDQVVALFEIGLNEDLLVQLIDLGVAVAPVIELRSVAVGVAAAGEIGNDIPAVERAWGPAQEVERRVSTSPPAPPSRSIWPSAEPGGSPSRLSWRAWRRSPGRSPRR